MTYDSDQMCTARRDRSQGSNPYQDSLGPERYCQTFMLDGSKTRRKKVDLARINSLFEDAEKRKERRRLEVEQRVE